MKTKTRYFLEKTRCLANSVSPFVFAFLLCQELFCPFHGGSYYVNLSLIFAALILIFKLAFDFREAISALKTIIPIYWIFLLLVVLSYINAAFYVTSFSDFSVALKGTIVFVAESLTIILVTILFRKQLDQMMSGLLCGIFANLLLSVIVYSIHLDSGYVLTLYDLFPRPAFYIPNGGTIMFQGLFLEPSQLTNDLLPAYFALLGFYKDKIHRFSLFFAIAIIFIFAGSGNIVVLGIGYLLIIIFRFPVLAGWFKKNMKDKRKLWVFVGIMTIFLAIVFVAFMLPSTRTLLLTALRGVNPFDASNNVRLVHMEAALEMFLKNPWGIGFNLTSLFMSRLYPTIEVGTAFNLLLARFVEMGVLGGLVYFLLFAKPAWILLTKRKNTANIYFATAIIVSLLLQFLNGRIYLTHYLVLGLVFPIINDGSITHIKI